MQDMTPRFLSMADTARRHSVSYKLIQKLVSEGTLPCVRFGRLVRIPVAALEQWEQAQLKGGEQ